MRKLTKCLVIIIALAVTITALVACSDKVEIDKELATWQNNLKDEALLVDTVLPGSHDSGTKGMIAMAETQKHTIGEQLVSGVRYFDIRVTRSKNGKLQIFHGPIKGTDFEEVVADIKSFVEKDNNQFVILDFQHFENDAEKDVIALINSELNPAKYALPNGSDLSTLTMGDIRTAGYKYMITWGASKELEHDFIMDRKTSLLSPYHQEAHKKAGEFLTNDTYPIYYAMATKDKVFVLQAVVTANSFVEIIKSNDDKFAPIFAEFIAGLKDNKEVLGKTNVVMCDFIVSKQDLIKDIIALNELKGNNK